MIPECAKLRETGGVSGGVQNEKKKKRMVRSRLPVMISQGGGKGEAR